LKRKTLGKSELKFRDNYREIKSLDRKNLKPLTKQGKLKLSGD
jgi:hypothetical protein